MTDTTTTTTPATSTAETAPVAPKPTVAQQIEKMVAARASDNPAPTVTIREGRTQESLIYNSATRELTTGDGLPPPVEPDAPITGTTAHEQTEQFHNLGTKLQDTVKKLDAHTFEPRTGQKVHTFTGEERRVLELQATSYYRAGEAVHATILKLQEQEASAAELNAQRDSERQARRAFSGGDPRRAEIFNEALARAEAEEAARLVIVSRRAK